jgi:hypothetical protein
MFHIEHQPSPLFSENENRILRADLPDSVDREVKHLESRYEEFQSYGFEKHEELPGVCTYTFKASIVPEKGHSPTKYLVTITDRNGEISSELTPSENEYKIAA